MLSATAVGTGESVRVTVTADEAATAFFASLNSTDTAAPLEIPVRFTDSIYVSSALTVSSIETNADAVRPDSLPSLGNVTVSVGSLSWDADGSGTFTISLDRTVSHPGSYDDAGFDSTSFSLSGTLRWQHDLQGVVLDSEESQLLLKIERPLLELSGAIVETASPLPGISVISAPTEKAAVIENEGAASASSRQPDSVGVSNNTSAGSRTRQLSVETRQAMQLVPGRLLLLTSPAARHAGGFSVAVSGHGAETSTVSETDLSGLAILLSSLTSPAQLESHGSSAMSGQSFAADEYAPPDGRHAATEFAIDSGATAGTLTVSLPAVALRQTAVSLAGMFEDLLLTLNSLLHAIGVAVGSESSGTQAPIAPTVAPVFPGAADPRQFAAGSQAIQSVLVGVSGNGQFQLEPFSRHDGSIQSLTLEFAPRHGQLFVRDIRKGMLEFEPVPGFDGGDSADWQATLDDGSSVQGTIVFFVDRTATQAAAAQASLFDNESPAVSVPRNTAALQAVPESDRDSVFSSNELLSQLLR